MIANFIRELRRRNVVRAVIAYAVTGWLVVQSADVLLPVFDAPEWVMRVLIGIGLLGLPVAIVFSWFYEVTPNGIKRTAPGEDESIANRPFDRRINVAIIAVLVAALALSMYGNLRSPAETTQPVSILIADFNNETGNELFSGVIEDFLLVGLEVAPFIEAYPRKSASNIAASLPGAGEGTTLDAETAALIALREGVDIVVGGTVSRLDQKITISVHTVSAGDQQQTFTVTESVDSDTDVLNAIVEISEDLRKSLGKTRKSGGAGDSESFAVTSLEAASEYLKAQDLQLDRKLEEAVTHYDAALQFDPDFARAYAGLALTHQYLGNADAAAENWQQALSRLDRLTERGRLRTLGNYYMINQGNYPRAMETYEDLVKRYPADNVAHNNLAVTAFYSMDFGRALEVGREVGRRFPGHSGYGANLALYAMYAGRFDEASDVARSVLSADAGNAYSLFVLALSSAVAGNLDETEKAYVEMTGLDQFARSIGAEGLADLAMYRGDHERAVEILDKAIADEVALGANFTVALKNVMKVEALLGADALDDARDLAASLVDNVPADPAILVPLAMSLIELRELESADAIADTLTGSLSKPRRAYALAVKAAIAASRGELDNAIELADSAVSTVDLWFARHTRAAILEQAGRSDAAAVDSQNCRERIGEGVAVFLNDRPSFRRIADIGIDTALAQ